MPTIDNASPNEENDGSEPDDSAQSSSVDPSPSAGAYEDDGKGFQKAWDYLRAGADSSSQLAETSHGERERQQDALIGWASQAGLLVAEAALDALTLISNDTSEHKVLYRESDERVVKITWPGFYGQVPVFQEGELRRVNATPAQYLERQILQDVVFGGHMILEGIHVSNRPSFVIGESSGQPSLVISQPWYEAGDERHPHPSTDALDSFMRALGFLPVRGSYFGWVRPEDGVMITDAKPDNFILTADGIAPIDLQIAQLEPTIVRQLLD